MVHLTVLAVPGCPNAGLLEERIAGVLGSRRDVTVSRHVIADEQEAARRGMHGSPTILVDGTDPFAGPGQAASVSCRLYRDSDGRADGAPSVSQLRQAIGEPASAKAAEGRGLEGEREHCRGGDARAAPGGQAQEEAPGRHPAWQGPVAGTGPGETRLQYREDQP